MSLEIRFIPALKDNFIYFLIRGQDAAVIDPGDAEPVRAYLRNEKLKLTEILCTHHHRDHIGGAAELAQETGARVSCSEFDRRRIPEAKASLLPGKDHSLFGETMTVIGVPGHTDGQVALYFPNLEAVFVGDTLFSAGCGRLFEGTPSQMFESLDKLKKLPPRTRIYFGHEYTLNNLKFVLEKSDDDELTRNAAAYRDECEEKVRSGQATTPTTVARELEVNPFVRAKTVEEFTHWRESRNVW